MVIDVCESSAYDILRLYQNPLLGFFSIQHKDEEGEETNLFDGWGNFTKAVEVRKL